MTTDRTSSPAFLTLVVSLAADPAQAQSGYAGPVQSYFWLLALGLVLVALIARRLRVPIRHRWRRRQARIMCLQLQGVDRSQPPNLVYSRLRGMDPLAFEELLLECFERRGCKVARNHRYTGDGGVDGKIIIQGEVWLVQAKRYAGAIRPEHVDAFASLCRSKRMRGLFIHTGRTGPQSQTILGRHAHIEILSGERLLALIHGAPLALQGVSI